MYQQVFQLHAELLKALAHPKRLEIIQLLRKQTLSVTEIQTMLDLPQANLSQHLQILRESGAVVTHRDGKQIFYRLSHPNFIRACDLMREILIEKHQSDPVATELSFKMSDLVPIVSDPVCGMRLSPKTAAFAHKHNGQNFYFCASGCFGKFRKNPDKYINQTEEKNI